MAGRVEVRTSVHVKRSPDEVFDYLADVQRHGEWSPKPWRCEGLDGPVEHGTTFTSYGWVPGDKEHRNDVAMTAVERPGRLAFTCTEKGQQFHNTFTLTPESGGTAVERLIDMPKPGGVLGAVFPLILATVVRPAVAKGMRLFKARAEAG